ncbi:MAG: phospho-N-acetylmuramoyl-pentapeptide-transferase [Planctomycetes bacterium]|nr:phospho-N-acetylmuramoyl-pentapeptide-transferase [Planctomycetota bacterium]
MGGFIIWFGWLAAMLFWGNPGSRFIWLSIATAVVLGAVGFADDFVKMKDPKRPGISARAKLAFQLVWGLAIGAYLYVQPLQEDPRAAHSLYFPLLSGWHLPLGLFFIPLVSLVITSSSNAVNLTDGLDGLAMGCSILVAMVFVVVAWFSGEPETSAGSMVPFIPGSGEVSVLAAGLVGAGLGFLWFNCHPAQVFMGDTGSLPLGGLLGLMAVLTKQELLFALAGGIFVIEALSVILQVASFKLLRKRIFLIAPLHHHYQFKGWSETKVTVRFWILAMLLTGASLVILRLQ